ncbi:outer membrane beta-barrel protein [Acetobacter suratthaniensis]|uniref:OmpW family protein n=1 Tax=Acetobacter suratthaniensis TaxID=1502841 RepID=A0ABS3LMR8_9PROT|nr:OmpW family outer membrane protein [Acetobacter suratthaniensis]MBO1328667.1 OmpW family protein [Acetobacter suratthaniensis]MCX2566883.1 outer membrane beta-barrel protein [Acetobacter suratthaniensis]
MVKFRSFLTVMVAGVATMTGAARAQTATSNAAYVNAPVVARVPDAPVAKGHCGIFETCASTKIGLGKGDIMLRLSGTGVLPQDRQSTVWLNNGGLPGTHLSTTNQAMPELAVEYFITDNLSVDLIATSTRHEVRATGKEVSGLPSGGLDVGSAWVLPPTLTFAWHFRPHKRFNPYVGVGATLMWFYNMQGANGSSLNSSFTAGPTINAGFDYQLVGNWFLNADVKQMFVSMHAYEKGGQIDQYLGQGSKIRAQDSLDPTVVSAGIAYRF